MEEVTKEDREAIALTLESAAAKIRRADGIPMTAKTESHRPMDLDTGSSRMRHDGVYSFKCTIELQFPPGPWIEYDQEKDDADTE